MTLAGTRPPTVDEYEQYELGHRKRLAMKPGLTGMWQVSGRSDISLGLMAAGDTIVEVLFTAKWLPMLPYVYVMCAETIISVPATIALQPIKAVCQSIEIRTGWIVSFNFREIL